MVGGAGPVIPRVEDLRLRAGSRTANMAPAESLKRSVAANRSRRGSGPLAGGGGGAGFRASIGRRSKRRGWAGMRIIYRSA